MMWGRNFSAGSLRRQWQGPLLAMDRNGNGTVDGAAELFGEYTDGRSFTDGFAALAELDSNHDGVVGVKDAAFGSLRLWIDANRDGVSQRTELRPLAAERITELALTFTRIEGRAAFDAAGNYAAYRSEFTRADGRRGQLVDVYFGFQPRVTK